ncbi:MAG: hypothetical protein ACPL7B_11415, partial [Candidatus Poribacteria bacterium]
NRSPGVKPNTETVNMWGERWIYPLDSLDGICIEHPIASYDALKTYRPPDPDAFTNWKQLKENFQKNNELGKQRWNRSRIYIPSPYLYAGL